ncbi:MAG: hypothetical protein HOE90_06960 [Bacteriovoracaceae bacterium]|jgi:hypothetical protein|nr:hypothetical protein [Bacteriovoracaceae bacterium]
MRKLGILCILCLWNASAFALSVPKDCFSKGSSVCAVSKLVKLSGTKTVQTDLWGKLDSHIYVNTSDVGARYFNFDDWDTWSDSVKGLQFNKSFGLVSKKAIDKDAILHYSHITVKAPWPVNKVKVIEVERYKEVKSKDGALKTYNYEVDIKGHYKIPGEADYNGAVGIKLRKGTIKLYRDKSGALIIHQSNFVIPSMDKFMKKAVKHTNKNVLAVFKMIFH